jgi:hypothetical protein
MLLAWCFILYRARICQISAGNIPNNGIEHVKLIRIKRGKPSQKQEGCVFVMWS